MSRKIVLYVSTQGRRGWSGRLPEPNAGKTDGPFASVEEAQAAIRSLRDRNLPITILIGGGTYRLGKPIVFEPEDSGTPQFPVTYAAYSGEVPVLSGGTRLTGWKETSLNSQRAWVTEAPDFAFHQLWVNDQRRYRPRLPKNGLYAIKGIAPERAQHDFCSGDREFYVEPGQVLNWENLDDVEIVALTAWVESRLPVESVDEQSGLVKTRLRSALTLANGAPFYVENVFSALDAPGLWYHQRKAGKIYYLPLPGERLDTADIVVPRLPSVLVANGNPSAMKYVEHIHFCGLCVAHTEWQRSDKTATMRFEVHDDAKSRQVNVTQAADDVAGDSQGAVSVTGSIEAKGVRHCRFDCCIVAHAGNYGLELGLGSSHNEISRCEFHDLGAGGVKLGTQATADAPDSGFNRVANCNIHNAGLIYHSAVGIWLGQTGNNTIENNHIHDLHYTGISVGWTWGYGESSAQKNMIVYNHIHDIGHGLLSDMGGIYTLGPQPGTIIRGNRIHGVRKLVYGAWCIYLDEGSSHILVEDNLCYDTNGEVFHQHYGRDNTLCGNVFAFGAEGIIGHGRVLGEHLALSMEQNIILTDGKPVFTGGYACLLSQRNHRSEGNIFWDISGAGPVFKDKSGVIGLDEWRVLGHDIHSVVADPKFKDPKRGDFTLAEDSPAIALGFHPFVQDRAQAGRENRMRVDAGILRIDLNSGGHITGLVDTRNGINRQHGTWPSDLLTVVLFGENRRLSPVGAHYLMSGCGIRLCLTYERGVTVDVDVVSRDCYARLRIMAVRDVSGSNPVAAAFWGPYVTNMTGAPGEFIGLLRDDGFSMGLLSLEPNTDGVDSLGGAMARYIDDGSGSCLEAETRDHTRDGVGPNAIAVHGETGLTVVGSSVAIFGCATKDELDVIEQIETTENLPHPTFEGIWIKRSVAGLKPSLWIALNEHNSPDCIAMAQRMGAMMLCGVHDMFGNWGHFDPDPALWPSGMAGIRKVAHEARASGIELVMYTLTTFIKPHPRAEPFVGPVPDDRLQTMGPATALAADVGADSEVLVLEKRENLVDALRIALKIDSWIERYQENQVVRVGNEIIYYRSAREEGNTVILDGCRRGTFDTLAATHARGTRVMRLYLNAYRNFYPGTLAMQDEVADQIARVALEGEFGQIIFDGHESCFETGHGLYSRNRLTRRIYEQCGAKIPLYTGSTLGNYDWHALSFIRWGEHDEVKGFRGSMLDYRLMRQVQLRRNLMPHGLGQYYPSTATLEDIEWLMARAAGWDASVDFHVYTEAFVAKTDQDVIMDTIRLWNQAQIECAFSEDQKRELRQTDRLYTLSRDSGGRWNLVFKGRWRNDRVKMLSPSTFRVEAATPNASVAPCGIDWNWTHNPAIFTSAGLSDDLICRVEEGEGGWTVIYPQVDQEEYDSLQFVLRLAPDARCAIRNPAISIEGKLQFVVPVVLQPGQYLSTVHDTPLVCIYNAAHDVISEVHVRGRLCNLPMIGRGRPHRLALGAEPFVRGVGVGVILNLRTHEQIKPVAGGQT